MIARSVGATRRIATRAVAIIVQTATAIIAITAIILIDEIAGSGAGSGTNGGTGCNVTTGGGGNARTQQAASTRAFGEVIIGAASKRHGHQHSSGKKNFFHGDHQITPVGL
jgi:hypothetical protein